MPQFTWHSNMMSFLSLGIEKADGGRRAGRPHDGGGVSSARCGRGGRPRRRSHRDAALRAPASTAAPEDLNLIWFAMFPAYTGPGDTGRMAQRYPGWRNTLFTERNYRALALLCRFLAERNGIPRNFPLLPYASVAHDTADAAVFRKLLLADPLADQIGAHARRQHGRGARRRAGVRDCLRAATTPSGGNGSSGSRPSAAEARRASAGSSPHDQRPSSMPRTTVRLAPVCARDVGLVVVSVRLRRAVSTSNPKGAGRRRFARTARRAATRRSSSTTMTPRAPTRTTTRAKSPLS